MIKIEVRDAVATVRNITSKAGKELQFREQAAYAFTLDRNGAVRPYPESIRINLRDGQEPYAVGMYTLAPASVWVDRFGGLALAPKLAPVK